MEREIKAEELRKGNKITDIPYGRELEVVEIKKNGIGCHYKGQQNTEIDGVRYSHFPYEDLMGIPLTPELLEKAGFKTGSYFTRKDEYQLRFDEFDTYLTIDVSDGSAFYGSYQKRSDCDCGEAMQYGIADIKYLHTLQNVVNFLTSSELKIEI